MKVLEQIGHQGDTQWFKIDKIPKDAEKINNFFIAKSEQSGSVHVLCGNYDMYKHKEGFIMDVKEDSILNHTFETNLIGNNTIKEPKELPLKDHRHSVIKKGLYIVGIQQRYDPFQKLWSKVRD